MYCVILGSVIKCFTKLKEGMPKISKMMGVEIFPLVWTIVLSKNKECLINLFSFRSLRYRCYFEKRASGDKLRVYFHLNDNDLSEDFSILPETAYLHGSFSHSSVCQIRSEGKLREMTEVEKVVFIRFITDRFQGKNVGDRLPITPSVHDQELALQKMESGNFYCFDPQLFFYNSCR